MIDPTGLLTSYCALKITVCKDNNGPEDVIPMVHFRAVGDERESVVAIGTEGRSTEALPMVVDMLAQTHEIEWIAFLCDSVGKIAPDLDMTEYHHGDFQRDYAEHADSTVREMLCVYWMDRSGKSGMDIASYHFDGPLPIFDPTVHLEGTSEGNIPEALKGAFR